jgi:hypothetical protein
MENNKASNGKKFEVNRYVVAIIMFLVYMGLFGNLHMAGKYYRDNGGYYKFDNKFNTVMGYFITAGQAPKQGAKVVSYVNPCSWGQDSAELKKRQELLRRATHSTTAGIEYFSK